ncbi:NADP-dependent malic enzyme [Alistipes sp. ZOR0009]|jgi:malate dehydrogenase (oxaloacetate-decarboxylating)(NADP+)|uniref:NADP-dependent malic enzyme n=1 Tax=Alistipes sp. ZOR0009 TaxID=1339253 RepID=UPI000645589F|nr:NADP-dependent malic enzyme [Alistipes sp. ZOR0009]
MSSEKLKEEALSYHAQGKPGKIEVVPTKPYSTQHDLALAYSPGVAAPCLAIEENAEDAYKYTAKGNLVAVISNGTAVLGLGNIGALASKPVMEGKGLLFKIFADIDVFDIEVDQPDVDKFVEAVKAIAPTFGGINLEDIKAPECFEIEERLKNELNIPVMHDDQHGTAIISSAALLNALDIAGKKIEEVQLVVNGAGASAVASTKLYIELGVRKENIIMCDSKGAITTSRKGLSGAKAYFATDKDVTTLEDALVGADVFLGLSAADVLTQAMVRSMAKDPIIFALANPDPEISYDLAKASRPDIIFATGRSDYPNQVNNVLGFPYIFRGALDVRATTINEAMKVAAVRALAALAKEPVPDVVSIAYNDNSIVYGREYLIPKPLDPRLISTISVAVAKAAIESGVARSVITDWETYSFDLERRMGYDNRLTRSLRNKAKNNPKRIVFAEGGNINILRAAQNVLTEKIGIPILLGSKEKIRQTIKENNLELTGAEIIEFFGEEERERRESYAKIYHRRLERNGIIYSEAIERMYTRDYFGTMMVEAGDADAFISGYAKRYAYTIAPALEYYGMTKQGSKLAGMYIVMTKRGPIFFADSSTMNMNPTPQDLVNTTLLVADEVRSYGVEPRIALLSNSNFGAVAEGSPAVVHEAVQLLHEHYPEVIVDGEMQVPFALNSKKRMAQYPFSKLKDMEVNTLIFPNFASSNIGYKLMQDLAGFEVIGPILLGMPKSIHVVPLDSNVRDIVNMATIAAVDAQRINRSESLTMNPTI